MKHSRSITNGDILYTCTASIYSFIIDFFSFESTHSYEPEILSGRVTSLIMVQKIPLGTTELENIFSPCFSLSAKLILPIYLTSTGFNLCVLIHNL